MRRGSRRDAAHAPVRREVRDAEPGDPVYNRGMPDENPFLQPSTLPFAFPPFDRIRDEHYRPAFEAGFAEQRAEVDTITAAGGEPTFADTVEALERSGRTLERVLRVYGNLTSSMATEEMRRARDGDGAPGRRPHGLHPARPRLFARLDSVHRTRGRPRPGAAARRRALPPRLRPGRGGAAGRRTSERLRGLNTRLTELTTEFGTRLLADTNARAVHLTDEQEVAGLAPNVVEAAASAAAAAGLEGWLLTLSLPTIQPAISSLKHRRTRRRLHGAAVCARPRR